MLHIFQLTYIYCINKLVTCETTLKMTHLIFLLKNVTTWRQMLSVFCLKFKNFKISSIPFLVANTNQNEKKIALPSSVCHGLPENAFQVNQLYNITWSSHGGFSRPTVYTTRARAVRLGSSVWQRWGYLGICKKIYRNCVTLWSRPK